MNAEFDYDLTPDQWETLKALRTPVSRFSTLNRLVVEDLIGLHLVTMNENVPVITRRGRKVLVRGSSRLWDVAA
jgi:hypothetical protein